MTREAVYALLDELDKGDDASSDEFTAKGYSIEHCIGYHEARNRLRRLEKRGLVSSRVIFRHGRMRVWKLVGQPKPQRGSKKETKK